jgi:hypothetical protein
MIQANSEGENGLHPYNQNKYIWRMESHQSCHNLNTGKIPPHNEENVQFILQNTTLTLIYISCILNLLHKFD